jgi:hypothetical protein
VTPNENEDPEFTEEGIEERTRVLAAPAFTVMFEEVTEMAPPVAVMVFVPAVLSVTVKEPTPEVRVAAEGRIAAESEEVMETVLAKEVAVLPYASSAVTLALKEVPAVALVEREVKERELAAPAVIVKLELVVAVSPVEVAERV